MERELAAGTPLRSMARHLLGLRAGLPGGRLWRRALSELPDGHIGLARLRALAAQPRSARRGVEPGAAYALG